MIFLLLCYISAESDFPNIEVVLIVLLQEILLKTSRYFGNDNIWSNIGPKTKFR